MFNCSDTSKNMNTGEIVNNRIYFYRKKSFILFYRKIFELFSLLNIRFHAFFCIFGKEANLLKE